VSTIVARFQRASGDSVEEQLRVLQENLERFTTEINQSAPGGGIWVYDNSTAIALSASWVKVNTFEEASDSDGVTPDVAGNRLVIKKPGVYFINVFTSIALSASLRTVDLGVFRSDGQAQDVELTGSHFVSSGGTGDRGSCCLGGPIRVNAGDALELFARSLSGAVNLTMVHANFSAEWRRP
jgi:hypothetical protein